MCPEVKFADIVLLQDSVISVVGSVMCGDVVQRAASRESLSSFQTVGIENRLSLLAAL